MTERGILTNSEISLVSQWAIPVPPSPDGSKAILRRFEELGITYMPNTVITSIDPDKKVALTSDGDEISYDLFLGIPHHRVPDVVEASGMAEGGWVPVDEKNLSTKFPDVYAVGDVTSAPAPKTGVFAESEARAVAEHLIAEMPAPSWGTTLSAKVNANFLPGQAPTAPFDDASVEIDAEKSGFAAERKKRWFAAP